MKKALYILIPVVIIAAVFFYLYKTQPEVIPFLDDEPVADTTMAQDTADLDMDEEQPLTVIDSLADTSLADTSDTVRLMDGESSEIYSEDEYDQAGSQTDDYSQFESWNIVVASVETEEMARKLLQLPAYSDMDYQYVSEVGSYRILAFSGASLLEAQQALRNIQARFPEAWISKF